MQTLLTKIRRRYIKNYIAARENALNHISLSTPKSIADVKNEWRLLSDLHSPLWTVLRKAVTHPDVRRYIDFDDPKALPAVFDVIYKRGQCQHIQKTLSTLYRSLDTLTPKQIAAARMQKNDAEDPFNAAIALAKVLPPPFHDWIQKLTNTTWQLVMADAAEEINKTWKTTVVTQYQQYIANRFPIYKNAQQDISLTAFKQFFGPNGVIEHFFNTELKPFVNTDNAYWIWKKTAGLALPISQEKLDMFIRAHMIQKMFYTQQGAPALHFTLTPIQLSPHIKRFVLNIGGQMLGFSPGSKQSKHLSWPSDDGLFVTMRFNTNKATNHPTKTFTGPWAWLHLLSQSTLTTTHKPTVFNVEFNLDKYQARYRLSAHNTINPYLPQVLQAFRCPSTL